MPWPQDSGSTARWTDQAVRDTIAAITEQPAYNRELGQSLVDRAVRFVFDQFRRLLEAVDSVPFGRTAFLAFLVVAVGLVIARLVMGIAAERRSAVSRQGVADARSESAQLGAAQQLAADGDYLAAAHVLFAVLVATGGARGEFRVHPSKTSGDYVRDIRRKSTRWLHPFQQFRQRYDRVIYGKATCTAEDYEALLRDVQTMLSADRAP